MGGTSSVFDSPDVREQELGKKIFSSLANLEALRDPSEWGIDISDSQSARETMCMFSAEPIPRSLTKLTQDLETQAVNVFQDLLRRMGDLPDISMSDKDKPIEDAVMKDQALCDEVYCQVMKQVNRNPSAWSLQDGFDVFQRVIDMRLPSLQLRDFVRGFLTTYADHEAEADEAPMTARLSNLPLPGPRKTMRRSSGLFLQPDQKAKMAKGALKKLMAKIADGEA